jgi:hypothetical protein
MKIRAGLVVAMAMGAVVYPPKPVKAQVMLVSMGEAGQVKDDLFAGTEKFAQGASDVTDVNLDKNMLGWVGKGKGEGKGSGSDLAHKMEFVVVHSYTYDKPGMYRMEDVEVFRKKLTDGSWNCFVHTRDKDGTTDICSRGAENGESNELVVMTAEPKELTFVHLKGHGISLDDLGKTGMVGGMHPRPPAPPTPPRAAVAPRAPMAPAAPSPPPAPAAPMPPQ